MLTGVDLLSFPIRLTRTGRFAAFEQGSDDAANDAITVTLTTLPGERELSPAFGFPDPTFGRFQAQSIQAIVDQYGPPVLITGVSVAPVGDTQQQVSVSFRQKSDAASL